MTSKTSARNTSNQDISQTVEGRVTVAGTGLFTVPTGKKIRVTSITGLVDAVGADATYAVSILRGVSNKPVGEMVAANGMSKFSGVMVLDAGDIITNVGDSGSTNGTVDMTASFEVLG
jgi:hypothetical protein